MAITNLGKFKLFSKFGTMGNCLIISAHGGVVPPKKEGFFQKNYKQYVSLQNGDAFWFIAPPNSSIRQEPYEEIMRKGFKMLPYLQAGKRQTEYPNASMFTANMSIQNMILTHFKDPNQQEKERVLIERAVCQQQQGFWDVLTVNKSAGEVTLEEAFEVLTNFCRGNSYSVILGHFCGVREGQRDDSYIYEQGYVKI